MSRSESIPCAGDFAENLLLSPARVTAPVAQIAGIPCRKQLFSIPDASRYNASVMYPVDAAASWLDCLMRQATPQRTKLALALTAVLMVLSPAFLKASASSNSTGLAGIQHAHGNN